MKIIDVQYIFIDRSPLYFQYILDWSRNGADPQELIDIVQAVKPSSFFSTLLLAASTQVRIALPQLNVLTKIDIVPEKVVEEILSYHENPEILATRVVEDKSASLMWTEDDILTIVERLSTIDLIPVSSTKNLSVCVLIL